jgi:hypothetical protein
MAAMGACWLLAGDCTPAAAQNFELILTVQSFCLK